MGSFKLRVVEPCAQPWDAMAGNDHARHCASCALTVHNLSALTESEARRVIAGSDGRLCVRFATRRDGTVVTRRRGGSLARAARALGAALLAVAFWASVVLLQRPWQAVARKLAAVPPAAPPLKVGAAEAPGLPVDLLDPPRPPPPFWRSLGTSGEILRDASRESMGLISPGASGRMFGLFLGAESAKKKCHRATRPCGQM